MEVRGGPHLMDGICVQPYQQEVTSSLGCVNCGRRVENGEREKQWSGQA